MAEVLGQQKKVVDLYGIPEPTRFILLEGKQILGEGLGA